MDADAIVLAVASAQQLDLDELCMDCLWGWQKILANEISKILVLTGILHCQSSTLTLDVTRFLSSEEKARKLHGIPGKHTQRLL